MVNFVRKKDPDWTLSVLKNLREFFDQNGMHDSADAIVASLRIVRNESLSVSHQTDVSIRPTLSQLH